MSRKSVLIFVFEFLIINVVIKYDERRINIKSVVKVNVKYSMKN